MPIQQHKDQLGIYPVKVFNTNGKWTKEVKS